MFLTVKTLHCPDYFLNLYENWTMDQASSAPIRMILPPDGKQTRIDFFENKPIKKSSSDWWHSLSSWFKLDHKVSEPNLEFFSQQLEKEGYSEKSMKSYIFMMKRFFNYFDNMEPAYITMGEIVDYNFEFFVSGRYSRSYQLQFINAIKLYYHLTEGVDLNLKQLRRTGPVRKIN